MQKRENVADLGYCPMKPEPFIGNLSEWWSRRIDDKNRIVYRIEDNIIEIAQCKGHYVDK